MKDQFFFLHAQSFKKSNISDYNNQWLAWCYIMVYLTCDRQQYNVGIYVMLNHQQIQRVCLGHCGFLQCTVEEADQCRRLVQCLHFPSYCNSF